MGASVCTQIQYISTVLFISLVFQVVDHKYIHRVDHCPKKESGNDDFDENPAIHASLVPDLFDYFAEHNFLFLVFRRVILNVVKNLKSVGGCIQILRVAQDDTEGVVLSFGLNGINNGMAKCQDSRH